MSDTTEVSSRQVRCGPFDWHVRSAGSGPLCLLLHGTGASVHTWDNLYPLLAPHYSLVMVDLPGHANTKTPADAALTLPAIAKALHALIEQEDLQAELIIGHSAGAAIMFELCLQYPHNAKQLISINAAVIPLNGLAGYLFAPLARVSATLGFMPAFFSYRAGNDRNIKKLLDSTGSKVDDNSFRQYAQLFRNTDHVAGVLKMMASWRLEALNGRLGRLQIPVLLIAGSNDKTIPLRDTYKLQKLLPADKVSVSVINNVGHLLHEEDPQAVASLIVQT